MSRASLHLLFGVLCVLCGPLKADEPQTTFELKDGDRVTLVGGTLVEREQRYGYWETMLTATYPDRRITFRNLGWSGDTVWGESRGMFEPEKGYERLVGQVQATNPTVLILAYGNNEAFRGAEQVGEFSEQYEKLLADIAGDTTRCVLLAPLTMDLPADEGQSPTYAVCVDLYAEAICELATHRGDVFIDFREQQVQAASDPLTDYSQIFDEAGYATTGLFWAKHLEGGDAGGVARRAGQWDAWTALSRLRRAIIEKNELFFYRWRPQNFTYLYGFRQHEQGQNAAEVPHFDPLIEQAEQRIWELKQTVEGTTD